MVEGLEKPASGEKYKIQEKKEIDGWKYINKEQNEIIVTDLLKSRFGKQIFKDKIEDYGIVLETYTEPDSDKPYSKMGGVYQDIKVIPGSELVIKFKAASVIGVQNTVGRLPGVKMEIFDTANPEKVLATIERRLNPASVDSIFNVPDNVNSVRIKFTDLEKTAYSKSGLEELTLKDGTKVYSGSSVGDLSLKSGSYIVSKIEKTDYESKSQSSNQNKIDTTITVSLENKGGTESNNTKYKVKLPKGAKFEKSENSKGEQNNDELILDIGSINSGEVKTIKYTISLPATEPLKIELNGEVQYNTKSYNVLNNEERKNGIVAN